MSEAKTKNLKMHLFGNTDGIDIEGINDNFKKLDSEIIAQKTQIFVSDFAGETDAIKIQAALDFAYSNKQKVVIAEERKYQLNATIKIREGVELRGERATHYSLDANLRGFELEQGASFCGGTISIGIDKYTQEVVYLDGKYKYDSASAKTVIRDLVIWNWTATTGGVGLSLFSGGETHQIQFLNIERLVIWNFDIGIRLKATEPIKGQTWINANRFDKITLSECNQMIVIESNISVPFECSGNIFTNLQIQPSTTTREILKISGMGNTFTGVLWDTHMIQHQGPIAEFTSTSSMNNINMMFFPEDRYVNNGENTNRIGVAGLSAEGELVERDWNTIQKMGTYRIIEPSGLTAARHQPVGAYEYGIMTVFAMDDNVSQFYVPHQATEGIYVRSKFGLTDWTSWLQLSSSAQLEVLKTAMIQRRQIKNSDDFNLITQMGTYQISFANLSFDTKKNQPPPEANSSGLLQITTNLHSIVQLYFPHSTDGMWFRSNFNNAGWTPWKLSGKGGGSPAIIESLSADPGNPEIGKMWIRSDL